MKLVYDCYSFISILVSFEFLSYCFFSGNVPETLQQLRPIRHSFEYSQCSLNYHQSFSLLHVLPPFFAFCSTPNFFLQPSQPTQLLLRVSPFSQTLSLFIYSNLSLLIFSVSLATSISEFLQPLCWLFLQPHEYTC